MYYRLSEIRKALRKRKWYVTQSEEACQGNQYYNLPASCSNTAPKWRYVRFGRRVKTWPDVLCYAHFLRFVTWNLSTVPYLKDRDLIEAFVREQQ